VAAEGWPHERDPLSKPGAKPAGLRATLRRPGRAVRPHTRRPGSITAPGRYQGCSASWRLTRATAGHAEPSLACYVLRGWRVSPRGMHPGGVPWAEGRQGHVGGGEAPQGPPALAHRHRLGLCGERARPARAAGITGGCHGPRVDRASPGSPYRRRKPPASHPQLAGQPRRPLPRPGAGVPAPAGGYPAGRCLRPPGPAGGTAGRARTGPGAPMVTWLPLPEAATLTAPAISQNQGGDPRAAARTAATADLTSSAPVPAVADLARPYHRRLPGAAATRSPRPAQADRRQRPRRTLPAPHPSPEAAGPMSPAPQASRPVTSTALAEPPYQGE